MQRNGSRILKAHSHSMNGGSIVSFSCVSMLFLSSWRVSSHIGKYDTSLQLFKNSIDTQEKLRLNLHSLSVSVSELSEYWRKPSIFNNFPGFGYAMLILDVLLL